MSREDRSRGGINEKKSELHRGFEDAERELGKDAKSKKLLEELSQVLRDAGTSEGRRAVRSGVTERGPSIVS